MARAKTVAVVGGGAAGLVAAVVAAERGCAVTVYEASDRVGRPILASGNGRCNFSNSALDPHAYHNAAFAEAVLRALEATASTCEGRAACSVGDAAFDAGNPFTRPVHEFFASHGLVWAQEGQGRLYPISRKATSVLDVLRFAALDAGVEFRCSTPIASTEPPRAAGKPFTLRTRDGEFKRADTVIVAVGGEIASSLLPEGVSLLPLRSMLGPLATNTDIVRALDNTRARARVTLCDAHGTVKARECGEVLFRKYGVSGIVVFNLSRFAEPGDGLFIDLLPEMGDGDAEAERGGSADSMLRRIKVVESFLQERLKRLSAVYRSLTPERFFRGLFTNMLAEAVCKQAGVAYEDPLELSSLSVLAAATAAFPLTVEGIGDAKQCQVHRGGVAVQAVDAHTMQLIDCPGLHVVGEALDVDGPCGGYNLHWAWSTALLAGLSCSAGCFGRLP